MSFREKLTLLRKKKGYTRIELAELVGVSYRTVTTWENGDAMPDIDKLVRLSEVLGVSTDLLLMESVVLDESGNPTCKSEEKRSVDTAEIAEYLKAKYKASLLASIAILIQVLSVIAFTVFITVSNETDKSFFVFIGLGSFVIIAYASILIFALSFKATKRFGYITKGSFTLSPGTEEAIDKAESENRNTLRIRNAIGVGFFVMALALRFLKLGSGALVTSIVTIASLLLLGIGVTLFVMSGIERSVLYTLKNPASSPEEALKRTEKATKNAIAILFVLAYLAYSFGVGDWSKSWLILVLWLATSAIASMAFSLIRKISGD